MKANHGLMEYLRKVPWSMIRGTTQLLVKLCLYLISTGRARMEILGMTINLHKIHSVLQTLRHDDYADCGRAADDRHFGHSEK